MKIIAEHKAGSTHKMFDVEVKQYDDSINVLFENAEERDKNKVINHNGINYYYGCGNQNKDGSYIAEYWKNRPVW
jgi:hypothetical protein